VYIDDLSKLSVPRNGHFIFMYADDIIILTPSITETQKLLHMLCERELQWLDMAINHTKSNCLRVGPRLDAKCTEIVSLSGHVLCWSSEMRYLGVNIEASRQFRVFIGDTERSFYRAANSIFGKIGRIASEEVVLQLIKSKCIPALLYGLEACPIKKSDLHSLDFVVNRFCMKLFNTRDMSIIRFCQTQFDIHLTK